MSCFSKSSSCCKMTVGEKKRRRSQSCISMATHRTAPRIGMYYITGCICMDGWIKWNANERVIKNKHVSVLALKYADIKLFILNVTQSDEWKGDIWAVCVPLSPTLWAVADSGPIHLSVYANVCYKAVVNMHWQSFWMHYWPTQGTDMSTHALHCAMMSKNRAIYFVWCQSKWAH